MHCIKLNFFTQKPNIQCIMKHDTEVIEWSNTQQDKDQKQIK